MAEHFVMRVNIFHVILQLRVLLGQRRQRPSHAAKQSSSQAVKDVGNLREHMEEENMMVETRRIPRPGEGDWEPANQYFAYRANGIRLPNARIYRSTAGFS